MLGRPIRAHCIAYWVSCRYAVLSTKLISRRLNGCLSTDLIFLRRVWSPISFTVYRLCCNQKYLKIAFAKLIVVNSFISYSSVEALLVAAIFMSKTTFSWSYTVTKYSRQTMQTSPACRIESVLLLVSHFVHTPHHTRVCVCRQMVSLAITVWHCVALCENVTPSAKSEVT